MSSQSPKQIELKGTPRQIGLTHGQLLRAEIRSQIEIYRVMFEVSSKLSWSAVLEIAEEFRLTIESLTPDICDEMIGIAEGAELGILDIVALNCRSEIALGRFTDGCTSLSWNAKIGMEDRVVLAQNWDWTAQVRKNLVMMSIQNVGKPTIYMVTEAGIVGKIGFNSNAVGACLNAVRARPTINSKIPVHIALRLCLESTSVKNAIERLEAIGGVASSQHILLADSKGAVGMEVSPLGTVYLKEENGLIAHTNHFTRNKLVEEPVWLLGSTIRLERLQCLVSKLLEEGVSGKLVTGELLRQRIFSDTFNSPQAICCEEDPMRPFATRSSTLFNIVMSLEENHPSAVVLWGKPTTGEEGHLFNLPWR